MKQEMSGREWKKMAMFITTPLKISYLSTMTSSYCTRRSTATCTVKPLRCSPLQQVETGAVNLKVESGIECEPCNGTGWLLCDFCKGQKTNVKAENKRIYRRCPSCRAVGYVLCDKCKVYKCVTFPNYDDGQDLSF